MQMKWVTWSSSVIRQKANLKAGVWKKLTTPNFPENVRVHASTWAGKHASTKTRQARDRVLGMLTCLVCLHACMRTCYDEMFYFRACLRTWRAFLSYLLYISILEFKNSYSKAFVCFVKLNIILIYILIPTYKTIWTQFKGSGKVNRYII